MKGGVNMGKKRVDIELALRDAGIMKWGDLWEAGSSKEGRKQAAAHGVPRKLLNWVKHLHGLFPSGFEVPPSWEKDFPGAVKRWVDIMEKYGGTA